MRCTPGGMDQIIITVVIIKIIMQEQSGIFVMGDAKAFTIPFRLVSAHEAANL